MFFKNTIIFSFFAITLCNASLSRQKESVPNSPIRRHPVTWATPAPLPTDYPLLPLNQTRYNCPQFSTRNVKFFTWDNKTCYYYPDQYPRTSTWHEANDFCRTQNATLLSIHSAADNYRLSHRPFFSGQYYSQYAFWTGLNSLDERGVYTWSDGSSITYSHVFSPNTSLGDPISPYIRFQGRCVSFRTVRENQAKNTYRDTGYWFKDDCNSVRPYICQRSLLNPTPPPTTPIPPGNCPPGWFEFDKEKCIQYVPGQLTFNQSVDKCAQLRGEIMSIHSKEEQDFLTIMTADKPMPYIGYNYNPFGPSYQWQWDDQSRADYTNFGIYNNNNYGAYCVVMVTNATQPGKWITANCTELHSALCQMKKNIKYKEPSTSLLSKCQLDGYEGFVEYRNSCYSLVDNSKATFKDSESACRERNGAHLVSVIDPFEQIFLNYYTKQFGSSDQYWIGYHSDAQTDSNLTQVFEWTDDWPSYYSFWDRDEPMFPPTPQEDCVGLAQANGTWRTIPCDTKMSYICKVTNNSMPDINTEKSGVCPHINTGATDDKTLLWVDVDKRQSHCYWFSIDRNTDSYYYTGVQTYSDASFHCSRRNGTLVSVHSMHEIMLLDNHFQKVKQRQQNSNYYTNYWLGLSKAVNGEFFWEDKSALDFTYWADGQNHSKPNDDLNDDLAQVCVESQITDGKWKQTPCGSNSNKRNFFVCQVAKENRIYHDSSDGSHAGKTAGVTIGVVVGVGALAAVVVFVVKRLNLKAPHLL